MEGYMCCLHETPRDFDWCEDNCWRYYKCSNVAFADDDLKAKESHISEESYIDAEKGIPKLYEVTITETLRKAVIIESMNSHEAEQTVYDDWQNCKYVLDAGSFDGVDFKARRVEGGVEAR